MLKIHFTADDLARTRLAPTLGQLSETVFALGMLQRSAGRSHRNLKGRLARACLGNPRPNWWRPHAGVLGTEHFLWLVDRDSASDDAAFRAAGLTPDAAAAQVRQLCQTAIAPHWSQVLRYLATECESRARAASYGGVEQLLSTLHSRIRWSAPVLTVAGVPGREVHLMGRGLLLSPSMFLAHRPAVFLGADMTSGKPALAFAAPPDDAEAARLFGPVGTTAHSLGALVGQTRAAILRELTEPLTTSQLAERLGISSANASQHATVLRGAGLITTRRVRNFVLHTITSLGLGLLKAEPGFTARCDGVV